MFFIVLATTLLAARASATSAEAYPSTPPITIQNSTVVCIEGLYTCGPLTDQGFGTISQCLNNQYEVRTICDDAFFHSCTLISGAPFCVEGEGADGVYSVDEAGVNVERRAQINLSPAIPRLAPNAARRVTTTRRRTTTRRSTARPTPTSAPVSSRDVVDPNTEHGKQGLTRCQYDIVLKITSVFETSNANLGFNLCGNWNDGQGISAGFIQFTTSSGSLLSVVQAYLTMTRRTNPPIASFVGALQTARSVGNRGQVSGQGHMTGLWGLCDAWQEANNNDAAAFQSAQMKIQSDGYLAPNRAIVQRLGIKTALGVGQIMDTGIQLGYSAIEEISRNAGWSPAQGASEADFLRRYLDARIIYLNNLGGAYPGTRYRINSYRHMLQRGNLNFVGGSVEMLENGGNRMTITC
ncbi:hypothetical protein HDU67_008577 [Dinochytrium kinnereticum]|nr:hypothetical protein HDU67_008577 [Dinochytrium kinnereticum]